MTSNDEIKLFHKMKLPELMERIDHPIDPNRGGDCIFCGRGQRTPNTHIKEYDDGYRIKCFACDESADTYKVISHIFELPSFKDQYAKALELFPHRIDENGEVVDVETDQPFTINLGQATPKPRVEEKSINLKDFTQDYARWYETRAPGVEYLVNVRHIASEVVERSGVGYDVDRGLVVVPFGIHFYYSRSIFNKQFYYPAGCPMQIDERPLDKAKVVFVTEAVICQLTIETNGFSAIALHGLGNKLLISALKKRNPDTWPTIVLALDNDDAGKNAQAKAVAELEKIGCCYLEGSLYGSFKDANERHIADNDGLADALASAYDRALGLREQKIAEKDRERLENQAAYFAQYNNEVFIEKFADLVAESATRPAISTGFPLLDHLLNGGFYAGLYFLAAISSLGKTSFILQIVDNIASMGNDVLFFSLEMSRFELAAKSISRLSFVLDKTPNRSLFKTTIGVLSGQRYVGYSDAETGLIFQAAEEYRQKLAKNMFVVEACGDLGLGGIRSIIDSHVDLTGRRPVIVIDYAQIIPPPDEKATDKSNMDRIVTILKQISRDSKVPIIAVSSVNRENYTAPINLAALKESGIIEFSADVVLGLQVAGADEFGSRSKADAHLITEQCKRENPRRIELKVLKNRNGQLGNPILYDFYPAGNYFLECEKGR